MITVSGNPVSAELINEYPQNSIERKVLTILTSSDKNYNYSSIEELKFELKLRKEIVESANELNKSGLMFKTFRKSVCNQNYWERTNEGGFRLKNGVKPSDAIRDIYENGYKYGTECATAMIIVYYKALLDIFPEDLFNELFSEIHLMNWHYIDKNLKEIGYARDALDYLPGDRRYFTNPDVDPVTPEWQGENVIDLGNSLYYGHGIGIKSAEKIISALNQNRKHNADESAYLLDSVGRPDFRKLFNIYNRYGSID